MKGNMLLAKLKREMEDVEAGGWGCLLFHKSCVFSPSFLDDQKRERERRAKNIKYVFGGGFFLFCFEICTRLFLFCFVVVLLCLDLADQAQGTLLPPLTP